ncbi:alpha/beta fold hydrolase [Cryptosporangium aurantiacum]|uniref:Pimeloyl-ACP methyl ester carboxylesterase n=1 Tax=Cryptosporangium aurantiacum TaxID=134849 RepID=A0A1M7REH9_9ACTN|nr:alpha/beta hydrolase [Cryptosporangium aurantiacum]SHN44626.1 Pimeloyl-ACP methyl ester carboxylesterase [Cryptosporangium aurantiacum]
MLLRWPVSALVGGGCMRLVYVHGACVRDASWWWNRMVGPIAAAGVRSRAVALPSCRGDTPGDRLGDLYDDVDAVRAVLDEVDEPAVLLGHSYGGIVITDAAHAHPAVWQLVYVTSMLPDVGESQASVAGTGPAPWLDPGADGTIGVLPDSVRQLFVQDCDGPTADAAVGRLTRQSMTPFGQPVRAAAWRDVPATYIVCTDDRAIPADVQRERATRAAAVVEFAAGHHPFLSRPEDFATLLLDVAAPAR